jgi:hypothetical protein
MGEGSVAKLAAGNGLSWHSLGGDVNPRAPDLEQSLTDFKWQACPTFCCAREFQSQITFSDLADAGLSLIHTLLVD